MFEWHSANALILLYQLFWSLKLKKNGFKKGRFPFLNPFSKKLF